MRFLYFLNPCSWRTRFSLITFKLNSSHGTFSLIMIKLKVGGKCTLCKLAPRKAVFATNSTLVQCFGLIVKFFIRLVSGDDIMCSPT